MCTIIEYRYCPYFKLYDGRSEFDVFDQQQGHEEALEGQVLKCIGSLLALLY